MRRWLWILAVVALAKGAWAQEIALPPAAVAPPAAVQPNRLPPTESSPRAPFWKQVAEWWSGIRQNQWLVVLRRAGEAMSHWLRTTRPNAAGVAKNAPVDQKATLKLQSIRYLAGLDNTRYPEVIDALLVSLDDPIEDVRFEAICALDRRISNPSPAGGVTAATGTTERSIRQAAANKVAPRLTALLLERDDQGTLKETSGRIRDLAVSVVEKSLKAPAAAAALEPVIRPAVVVQPVERAADKVPVTAPISSSRAGAPSVKRETGWWPRAPFFGSRRSPSTTNGEAADGPTTTIHERHAAEKDGTARSNDALAEPAPTPPSKSWLQRLWGP